MTNLAIDPYYDDYDETKNYHQILFKPGTAVQARELTQIQSAIQKQIEYFGNHIFKDGAIVTGGGASFNNQIYKASITGMVPSAVFGSFASEWYVISGTFSGKVVEYTDSPATIFFQKIGGTLPINGASLAFYDLTNYTLLVASSPATSGGAAAQSSDLTTQAMAFVAKGVTYINGRFVYHGDARIVLGDNPVTTIVGFDIQESFVTNNQDFSLLDPDSASSNYANSGADRLMIDLVLTTNTWDGKSDLQPATDNFVELMRIKNGVVQAVRTFPVYANILDTMARRTYDESGDYITSTFYATTDIGAGNDNQYGLAISPGKAYVHGYEIEKTSSRIVGMDKARDFESVTGADVVCYYGNYTLVTIPSLAGASDVYRMFNETSPQQIKLYNVAVPTNDTTLVGTAFVKTIEHSKVGNVFRLYLFDINMTVGSFGAVRSFLMGTGAAQTCRMIVDASAIDGTTALLFDTQYDASVFPFAQPWVKSVESVDYYARRLFADNVPSTNQFTLTTLGGSERFAGGVIGAVPNDTVNQLYTVYDRYTGNVIDMTGAGRSIVINDSIPGTAATAVVTFAGGDGFGSHHFDVIATLDITDDATRIKTLTIVAPQLITGAATNTTYSLGALDVDSVRIFETAGLVTKAATYTTSTTTTFTSAAHGFSASDSVYVSFTDEPILCGKYTITSVTTNTFSIDDLETSTGAAIVYKGTDLTDSFAFDNGQRDSYYDFATIKTGAVAPADFTVLMNKFDHSGSGKAIYNLHSFVNIPYNKIGTYTTMRNGVTLQLRDCLDFRFDRTDTQAFGSTYAALTSTSFSTASNQLPSTQFFSIANCAYSYYLSRIDKLVLMSSGEFRIVNGTSAFTNPQPPTDVEGGLTLFEIKLNAYTDKTSDILVKRLNHRVYTMKDIGELDRRITSLEYYTQLSLLENETTNKNIYDASGASMFKNGFLVDSFTSYQVVDEDPGTEFNATINLSTNVLQPKVLVQAVDFSWNATSTAAKYESIAIIPYVSTETFLSQTQASHIENVNPYNVIRAPGNLTLSPSSDTWMDVDTITTTTIVEGGAVGGTTTSSLRGTINSWGATSNGANQTSSETSRFVAGSTFTNAPWIRSRTVQFEVSGVRPNTHLYLLFDNQEITDLMSPSVLVTNSVGYATGSFTIPNTVGRRFKTGISSVFLADINNVQDFNHDTSFALAQYVSSGTLRTDDVRVTINRVTVVPPPAAPSIDWWWEFQDRLGRTTVDPLAQTFKVSGSLFPGGIFVTSLTLFFVKKAANKPVWVQLRPTVNGYPDAKVIHPFSTKFVYPADIQVSEDTLIPTEFVFPVPVHLPPGEHCFVVLADTDEYEIHTAQNGGYDRVTQTRIMTQPLIGSMFKSQNGGTWDADQWSDISFILKKAVFPIGTAYSVLLNNTASDAFEYGRINVPQMDIQLGGVTSGVPNTTTTYQITTKKASDDSLETLAINPSVDVAFNQLKHLTAATTDDVALTLTLTTNQRDISPIIDLEKSTSVVGDWVINNDSTNETVYSGGNAIARYVTKMNTLSTDDANHLQVTYAANRVTGTDVKIYYKIKSATDPDVTPFSNRPWVEMARTPKAYDTALTGEYIEDDYSAYNITYVSTGGGTPTMTTFKYFAIKVVLLSSNKCFAPTLANLRVIAGS